MALPGGTGFEQVVLPHLDAAHNLARWLVRDPTLAEDVVQDAILRALGYFASFRGGDARAWLLRIVRNAAYTALAARRGSARRPGRRRADGDEPPRCRSRPGRRSGGRAGPTQDLQRLDRALAALPVELRECLVLRELEELSYKEIAQVTGVPIGTVMSRLWRARRALLQGRSKDGTP